MSARPWDHAASNLPARIGDRRRPEIVALPPHEAPDVETLFTFMRDAELRFETLRLRIEERTGTALGDELVIVEAIVRHPGLARVTTTFPDRPTMSNYEVWVSDGASTRTYSSLSHVATDRPVRRRIVGLDDGTFPGRSRTYRPLTALPMETLPETFVHPAGLCQNVLATGRCWISGIGEVAGREAIVVDCDHPRTVEMVADRPDHHLRVAVDARTGIVLRLVQSLGGIVTRDAVVTALTTDTDVPDSAFTLNVPAGANPLY